VEAQEGLALKIGFRRASFAQWPRYTCVSKCTAHPPQADSAFEKRCALPLDKTCPSETNFAFFKINTI
jgi:hypothetical protein